MSDEKRETGSGAGIDAPQWEQNVRRMESENSTTAASLYDLGKFVEEYDRRGRVMALAAKLAADVEYYGGIDVEGVDASCNACDELLDDRGHRASCPLIALRAEIGALVDAETADRKARQERSYAEMRARKVEP